MDYARDLVRGGRYLERLQVGAFDVADLYRAAWVQAVSALDHWVHRELYERALAFALQVSVKRLTRFLQIQVPMSLFEDVHHHSKTMREAFRAHLRTQFGHLSFQTPDKIKQALANVSDVSLWPGVATELAKRGETITSEQVQTRLREIVKRRNRIAHEADRDQEHPGARTPIADSDVTATIDWLEHLTDAILVVLGPQPNEDIDKADRQDTQRRKKWTRKDIDNAVQRIYNPRASKAVRRLLHHADAQNALFRGGVGPEPSAGIYYWFHGHRRSLWSLYLSVERPSITLNLGSVWPRDRQLAYRMIGEIRCTPALDAALLHDDETIVRKYPSIDLVTLAESPDGDVLELNYRRSTWEPRAQAVADQPASYSRAPQLATPVPE